jgi:hypothetical protein
MQKEASSCLSWTFSRRPNLTLAFRLEVYPEAKPKDKYYAYAPKYFNLELGIAYWVLYFWCNRNEQAMLCTKSNNTLS